MGMIPPEQDSDTKAFFQRQWRRPLHRFGKMLLPIILSSMTIFFIFYAILLVLFWEKEEQWRVVDDQMGMVIYSFVSVLLGIVFSLIHYYWRQRRQSQFVPISIREETKDNRYE